MTNRLQIRLARLERKIRPNVELPNVKIRFVHRDDPLPSDHDASDVIIVQFV